ncbi:MAG: hypothetical protein ACLQNE_12420, partial [Thermoguttaceae bacterium]
RTDTFGVVQLEAVASGVPIAAFPVTGPKDVVGNNPIGVLHEEPHQQSDDSPPDGLHRSRALAGHAQVPFAIDPVHESGATKIDMNFNGRTNDLLRPFILLPHLGALGVLCGYLRPLRSDAYRYYEAVRTAKDMRSTRLSTRPGDGG